MNVQRVEFLKEALIKQELETTPWEALEELAFKHLHHSISELSLNELEKRAIETIGQFGLHLKEIIEKVARYLLVCCTKTEVLDNARMALKHEYDLIGIEDLEILHRLFVRIDQTTSNIPNEEIDSTQQLLMA